MYLLLLSLLFLIPVARLPDGQDSKAPDVIPPIHRATLQAWRDRSPVEKEPAKTWVKIQLGAPLEWEMSIDADEKGNAYVDDTIRGRLYPGLGKLARITFSWNTTTDTVSIGPYRMPRLESMERFAELSKHLGGNLFLFIGKLPDDRLVIATLPVDRKIKNAQDLTVWLGEWGNLEQITVVSLKYKQGHFEAQTTAGTFILTNPFLPARQAGGRRPDTQKVPAGDNVITPF